MNQTKMSDEAINHNETLSLSFNHNEHRHLGFSLYHVSYRSDMHLRNYKYYHFYYYYNYHFDQQSPLQTRGRLKTWSNVFMRHIWFFAEEVHSPYTGWTISWSSPDFSAFSKCAGLRCGEVKDACFSTFQHTMLSVWYAPTIFQNDGGKKSRIIRE